MKKIIPFFNYQYFFQAHGDELKDIIQKVLQKGAFILQEELLEFEKQFAEYLQVKHAIGVANCTDGLRLGLQAIDIRLGDEVIFPSHTFVATASAIHDVGAIPIPVESGEDHLLDIQVVEKAITDKTRAIMPVQLNGRVCDMDTLQLIADKYNLLIIEDAAQALGAAFKGKYAGSFGKVAAFSFYPAKTLGCLGDGGMVVTNDDEVADKLKLSRDHGRNEQGEVVVWGCNSRLDNIQAAILSFFLKNPIILQILIINKKQNNYFQGLKLKKKMSFRNIFANTLSFT